MTGSSDSTLCVWDVQRGEKLAKLTAHAGGVVQTHITQWRMLSAGSDGIVKVWDARTLACSATLAGHTGVVRSLQAKSDAEYTVVTSSDDATVKIWDLRFAKRSRLTLSGAWLTRYCALSNTHLDPRVTALALACCQAMWTVSHAWLGTGQRSCRAVVSATEVCACGTFRMASR